MIYNDPATQQATSTIPHVNTSPHPPQTHQSLTEKAKARLAHLVDELGDGLFSVTSVTALDVTDKLLGSPSTVGVGQLEGPQKGGGLLEVGSAGGDFVDEVLDTWGEVVLGWCRGKRKGGTYR